jgi:hypothetical protein
MSTNLDSILEEIQQQVKKLRFSESSFKKFSLIKIDAIQLMSSLPSLSTHVIELEKISPKLDKPTFVETFEEDKKNAWRKAKYDFVLVLQEARKIVRRQNIISVKLLTPVNKMALENLKLIKSQIRISEEADFYKEVIKCYEVGAFRSAIVMMWNLTINHMFDYVLKHKLSEYNTALTNKFGKKAKLVSTKEDFSIYRESEIIEILKSSRIIDKNIRKILDNKLGVRNTFAHPSNLIVVESKVVDVIEDLTNNVIRRYQI